MEPGGQSYFAWFHRKVLVCFSDGAAVVLASSVLVALRLHCYTNYSCKVPNGQLFFIE